MPGSEDPVYGLSTVSICTQTNVHIMRDCFRSFPSGHSSSNYEISPGSITYPDQSQTIIVSFAGLGFLVKTLNG